MSKIFSEEPKASLKEWVEDKGNIAKIIELSGIHEQFKDILEILPHVPVNIALKEIFQIFEYSFQVN